MRTRPVVGVTASARGGRWMWWANQLAVWRAGGRARRITAEDPGPPGGVDALLVGGGDDIDADLYGLDLRLGLRIDKQRDRLELDQLERAHARSLPILGVCRGAQILNVFRGGTLHPDIYEAYGSLPPQRTLLARKRITIVEDSRLYRVMGLRRCRVNSLHHQSIDQLGQDLRAVARDKYRIVQGVDCETGQFVLGVQWHPEFVPLNSHHQALYQALVAAA
ncbi:gamma-glutamyl-gamma-aminobutyrate hydrolase family protein [Rhodovibrio sodomensis]|nr:type 1 glutamine amidotransferase [Rhodovibrio sodomensis]